MALTNVIGRCKCIDVIDAIPLLQRTLCDNTLFACKCDCLENCSTRDREMNVNISYEFNFPDVHGAMNHIIYIIQRIASKDYMNPFYMQPTVVH